jgi:putative redox protein
MIQVRKAPQGALQYDLSVGRNHVIADEPVDIGGDDAGPSPHDLLDMALGACTAITVTLVAKRKQMPLEDVRVEITHDEANGLYKLNRKVEFVGNLTDEQRTYLLGIANKCPIHKALSGKFEIATEMAS